MDEIEERYKEEARNTIETPWNEINTILGGGLGTGDLGLLVGNPGGGKSWALVALGGHAVKLGYTVLHYTLELSDVYVGQRYDAFFTEIPVNEIKKLILSSIPDANIEIKDLMGDSNHYAAVIQSKLFNGLSKIEQHKLVYKSLRGKMGNELHALSITTKEI